MGEKIERIRINRQDGRDAPPQDKAQAPPNATGEGVQREAQQPPPKPAADPSVDRTFGKLELVDSGKAPAKPAARGGAAGQAQAQGGPASGSASAPSTGDPAKARYDRNNLHQDFKGRGQPMSAAQSYRVRGDQVQPARVNCTRPRAPDPGQCRPLPPQQPAQDRPPAPPPKGR